MSDINNKYKNPFPVTAVANFYNNMQNSLIVETNVIKEMKEIVSTWYTTDDGVTVAIQGEYGSGKTQLAIEMRKYIKKHDEGKYHFVCLDSPSVSFIEMYKNRFLNEITKREVLERLEEYYLDIVLQDLKKDELYGKIFNDTNKVLKSYDLIKHLGLPKSRYDRVLRQELVEVTANAKFVPALLLLMMPQFEEEVWRWLNGAEPTDALREREVDFVINNDTLALEAIGVFAFLFGKKGHRLVLFIDEMEKIMSNPRQTQNKIIEALKKLFETVKYTKTLLILCGLPDYYEVLPKDAKDRIGYKIKTQAVTLDEISNYVTRANEEKNNFKDIIPFTEEILRNILDIARGNIRTIIRLLYHSSNWYIDNQRTIDENALCIILKNAYGAFDIDNITSIVTQLIISRGWLFEEKKKIEEQGKKTEIDIFLPAISGKKNTKEKGIEIYIAQNVISDDEYDILCKRISDNKERHKIVIIEGFIIPKFKELLLKKVKMIMEYRTRNFKELFISVIEGEKAKYENIMSQNNLLVVNEKIESLSRLMNRVWADMNENMIGKKEFYYFMKKLVSDEDEVFYKMPDKDSEFYLIINEIQRVVERNSRAVYFGNSECDLGIFYFIREITYIIYYMVEEPQKIEISYSSKDIYEICQKFRYILREMIEELDVSFMEQLKNYDYLLEYLIYYMEQMKLTTIYSIKRGEMESYIDNIYEMSNIYELSHQMRQVSQNFCAYILINEPETFGMYSNVFNSFYYFLNVIEASIIQRKIGYFDLIILREYYDLIIRGVRNADRFLSRLKVSHLFEHYEATLRRFMNEAE